MFWNDVLTFYVQGRSLCVACNSAAILKRSLNSIFTLHLVWIQSSNPLSYLVTFRI